MRRTALILLSLTAIAVAEEGRVNGPISGLVLDDRSVRAIVGVPGSSHLGARLYSDLDHAAVSPDRVHVLFTKQSRITLASLRDQSQRTVAEGPSRVMQWSAGSESVAFENSGHIFTYRVSDESLTDLGAAPGEVTGLAVDSQGIVFAAVSGSEAGIYRVAAGEPSLLLARLSGTASLNLDGTSLLFTDSGQAFEITSLRSGGAARVAPDATEASAIARHGRYLLVADHSAKAVLIYDNASRALLRKIDTDFAPTRMEPLGGGIFLLNTRSRNEALYVVSLQNEPNVYFVPAGEEQ